MLVRGAQSFDGRRRSHLAAVGGSTGAHAVERLLKPDSAERYGERGPTCLKHAEMRPFAISEPSTHANVDMFDVLPSEDNAYNAHEASVLDFAGNPKAQFCEIEEHYSFDKGLAR